MAVDFLMWFLIFFTFLDFSQGECWVVEVSLSYGFAFVFDKGV